MCGGGGGGGGRVGKGEHVHHGNGSGGKVTLHFRKKTKSTFMAQNLVRRDYSKRKTHTDTYAHRSIMHNLQPALKKKKKKKRKSRQ